MKRRGCNQPKFAWDWNLLSAFVVIVILIDRKSADHKSGGVGGGGIDNGGGNDVTRTNAKMPLLLLL